MARKPPVVTTTVIRGPAAAAEMRQMERQGQRQASRPPVNPVTRHLNDANRTSSAASKEKAGQR
jgi:hypothetical protein